MFLEKEITKEKGRAGHLASSIIFRITINWLEP